MPAVGPVGGPGKLAPGRLHPPPPKAIELAQIAAFVLLVVVPAVGVVAFIALSLWRGQTAAVTKPTAAQAAPEPSEPQPGLWRSTSPASEGGELPPPSHFEELVANAGSILYGDMPGNQASVSREILAGFATTLAMIPESIAFSFVAGVTPVMGLWSAVGQGFFAAALGGRAGVASGAAGSTAVVMAALSAKHGTAYLSGGVLLGGLIQILLGLLGCGKFIRLVPHPVMLGFVNGLAIVIARAQFHHFHDHKSGDWLDTPRLTTMIGLTIMSMALVIILPRVTTRVPSPLLTVFIVGIFAKLFELPAKTLVDMASPENFVGGLGVLPSFGLPPLPWGVEPGHTLALLLPAAARFAAVGLIESLLTLQLVDGLLDDGVRGDTAMECIGQGVGNVVCGLTGGMGGCAMIGQTQVNVQSGATTRLAAMSMSFFLGLAIVCGAPLLGHIPLAALVGIMFIVCIQTFSWSSMRIIRSIPLLDALVIATVSIVTVVQDLAMAVIIGTILSALSFAWQQSTNITATKGPCDDTGWTCYSLRGLLFFGSVEAFDVLFDPAGDKGDDIIADFAQCRVMDHSALEAINEVARKYGELNKRLHLRHLSSDCAALLRDRNGELPPYQLVEVEPGKDPLYQVLEESSLYLGSPKPKLPEEAAER